MRSMIVNFFFRFPNLNIRKPLLPTFHFYFQTIFFSFKIHILQIFIVVYLWWKQKGKKSETNNIRLIIIVCWVSILKEKSSFNCVLWQQSKSYGDISLYQTPFRWMLYSTFQWTVYVDAMNFSLIYNSALFLQNQPVWHEIETFISLSEYSSVPLDS